MKKRKNVHTETTLVPGHASCCGQISFLVRTKERSFGTCGLLRSSIDGMICCDRQFVAIGEGIICCDRCLVGNCDCDDPCVGADIGEGFPPPIKRDANGE